MVPFSSNAKGVPGEVRQLTITKQQNIDRVGDVVEELSDSYLSWKNSSCHLKGKNTFLFFLYVILTWLVHGLIIIIIIISFIFVIII